MKIRIAAMQPMPFTGVLRTLAFAASVLSSNAGTAADIRVFSSGAPSQVAKTLAGTFSTESGHRVLFTVGTPGAIRQRLASGETPDVVVLPRPAVDALEKTGALQRGSRIDLARVGIGVVVREGAPLPDISTVDAVRRMLLAARSIVHTDPAGSGFAGKAVVRMIAQMGIADAIKPKVTIMQAIDGGVVLVAKGDAEVGMFNISEIMPVKGVKLVGPLPPEVQNYIVFTAAIHSGSPSPEPAQAFIRYLSSPAARERWSAGGLESLRGGS